MQETPGKTFRNYNESVSNEHDPSTTPLGSIELHVDAQDRREWEDIITMGLGLVRGKINELLGEGNQLTSSRLAYPTIHVVPTDPVHPKWAGYFRSDTNEITLVANTMGDRLTREKVVIHEFLHFLCHNGRDDTEGIHDYAPIAQRNNVGFRRNFGVDIRKGKENQETTDYFLAFNEAVTEQLAIDILPEAYHAYGEYLGLLNQVIDDAVTLKLGSQNQGGIILPWSRDDLKNYIYVCFFRGDLAGFTNLLQTIYAKYDISEQQFGLMTNKGDLPSVIESELMDNNPSDNPPGSPPPAPRQVAAEVQRRLDNKAPNDYTSDIADLSPRSGGTPDHGAAYDEIIRTRGTRADSIAVATGVEYSIDNHGLVIYHGDNAAATLAYITGKLDALLARARRNEVSVTDIEEQMDDLLFTVYRMSMLSDGFRDFYTYKHTQLDSL